MSRLTNECGWEFYQLRVMDANFQKIPFMYRILARDTSLSPNTMSARQTCTDMNIQHSRNIGKLHLKYKYSFFILYSSLTSKYFTSKQWLNISTVDLATVCFLCKMYIQSRFKFKLRTAGKPLRSSTTAALQAS